MENLILTQKNVCALVGLMLALMIVWSANANAQGADFLAAKQVTGVTVASESNDTKEELSLEDFSIEIEEIASVTFINKYGEVVAVLEGDKSVLEDIYRDKISKSYFMSSYGIHDVYLIK